MIDLHIHVLPGIDDGARSLEMAVAMCRLAAVEGCEALVATPHQRRGVWWNCDGAALDAALGRLQEAVGETPRLLPGGEIRVDGQLLAELGRLPESGLQPLAGSRYLLIEFDGAGTARQAIELVHELIVAGWRPVVAHPELIPWLAEDEPLIERLVELGAATQVTAMSVTGEFGRRAEAAAHRLIEGGLAHFVASDAHDLHRRPPGLRRAGAAIAERWGEEVTLRLLDENPRAVLADRPLAALRPQPERTAG